MRRYGGVLVHCARDEEGVLEVVDAFGVRSLHFGTSPRQSAISLTDPDRVELSYVRAMLISLLFVSHPCRILLLGLGGGTMAKFLLANYPDCQIEAVERRSGVAKLAREFFGLPSDPRLQIHIGEAAEFAHKRSISSPRYFDLILIDAYDHQGMDGSINAEDFFRACDNLLAVEGVLSINLWGTQRNSYAESTDLLRTCFAGRSLKLPVPNKGNVIGIAMGAGVKKPDKKAVLAKAKGLEIQFGIEMPFFLRCLRTV